MYYQNPTQTRQDFYQIRDHCLRNRSLFEDPEFPPTNSSLFVEGRPSSLSRSGDIVWKRPFELVSRPKFFADGVSRFDVIQGELGNCWFIAAVSNLTLHQNLFEHVVPLDNTFEQGRYCGAFHFRFWSCGYWIPVVVDDRLPCNSRGKLQFMQSQDPSEFWSCLLEKAYAKFHGSYQSLSGGVPSEALQDFSGGIVEIIDIRENRARAQNQGEDSELFPVMKKAHQRGSLMTCALHNKMGSAREVRTGQGLVEGHAYSITSVEEIPIYNGVQLVQLLRIRNPWGGFEWNGAWSDGSRDWSMVDPSIKQRLGITKRNDGEFWMSAVDFESYFHRLEICHLSPDPVSDGDLRLGREIIPWKRMVFEGSWVPGRTAGGCMNHATFASNPQYFFDFTASSVDGDADRCTVVVSLIQRTTSRTFTRKEGLGKFCIGFRIFRVKKYTGPLEMDYFRREASLRSPLGSGPYIDSREISGRFELLTGTYVIIPSTFEPNMGGNFLLRIFSEPPPPQYQPQTYAMPPPQPQQWNNQTPQFPPQPQMMQNYPPSIPPPGPQFAPQFAMPPTLPPVPGGYGQYAQQAPPNTFMQYGAPPPNPQQSTAPPPPQPPSSGGGGGAGYGWNL